MSAKKTRAVGMLSVEEYAQKYRRCKYGPRLDGTYTMRSEGREGRDIVLGTTVFDLEPIALDSSGGAVLALTRNGQRLGLSDTLIYASKNPRFFGWIVVREREFGRIPQSVAHNVTLPAPRVIEPVDVPRCPSCGKRCASSVVEYRCPCGDAVVTPPVATVESLRASIGPPALAPGDVPAPCVPPQRLPVPPQRVWLHLEGGCQDWELCKTPTECEQDAYTTVCGPYILAH
jgi:hypothetical protein